MKPRLGLRGRVLASFVVLLVVSEVASIGVFRQISGARLDEQVDAQAQQASEDFRAQLHAVADTVGQPGGPTLESVFNAFLASRAARSDEAFLTFINGSPSAASANPPSPLQALEPAGEWSRATASTSGDLDTPAGAARYLVIPVVAAGSTLGSLVVVEFLQTRRAAVESTVVSIALVNLLILLASAVLAWVAAGRALRPLNRLAATTRTVSGATDLDTRIPVTSRDEVGELAGAFNAMLDRLDHAFAAQKEFLDDAGHELRTPITIVRGHLEVMGDDPAERAETVALVLDELDRMDRLVGELRLLARAERPDFITRTPTTVWEFADDLFAKVQAMANRAWRLDAGDDAPIAIDRHRLTEAVTNLVDNAVHATNEGDAIVLGVSWHDGDLQLSVSDRGAGVAADELEHLFQRDRVTSHREGGTGLGLPIVAAIATAHGGEVTAESAPDRGSVFTIRVPAPRTTSGDRAATGDGP